MAEANENKNSKETTKSVAWPQVVGIGLVLIVLAGYFVWMTMEMGTAAVSGAAPMVAFLAAAAVGIAAAGAAFMLGRRQR